MVKFKATARETGNSIVVTIPRALVQAELIQKGREYEFECVKEVSDGF